MVRGPGHLSISSHIYISWFLYFHMVVFQSSNTDVLDYTRLARVRRLNTLSSHSSELSWVGDAYLSPMWTNWHKWDSRLSESGFWVHVTKQQLLFWNGQHKETLQWSAGHLMKTDSQLTLLISFSQLHARLHARLRWRRSG